MVNWVVDFNIQVSVSVKFGNTALTLLVTTFIERFGSIVYKFSKVRLSFKYKLHSQKYADIDFHKGLVF